MEISTVLAIIGVCACCSVMGFAVGVSQVARTPYPGDPYHYCFHLRGSEIPLFIRGVASGLGQIIEDNATYAICKVS